MDPQRFDALAHALATPRARRAFVRLLGASLVASRSVGELGTTAAKQKKKSSCKSKPDGARCRGGRCLLGTCRPKPTCLGSGVACIQDGDCCNNDCRGSAGCRLSSVGQPCLADGDSNAGLRCVGYVCLDTSCPAASDYCADGAATCAAGAYFCLRPLDGGASRCGVDQGAPTSCGCASHAECQAGRGPGAFCAKITGAHCNCADRSTTFCAFPA